MSDDNEQHEERIRKRDRRRPRGRRRLSELREGAPEQEPGLAELRERGLVGDLHRAVKSGKEADVYLADGPEGAQAPLIAKIYRDPEAGGFRIDPRYLEGRHWPRGRLRKLLDRSARAGLDPQLALWVLHEVRTLWDWHDARLPVPRPALGPDAQEVLAGGRVVLMEFVGEGDEPAPRLADAALAPAAAAEAWRQARAVAANLLALGWVHGDLSTFNLLWHEDRAVLIDVPQAIRIDRNPHAADLLSRDARSLAHSFRQLGIDADPAEVEAEVRAAAGQPPSGPLLSP